MEPIICDSCGSRVAIESLTEDAYRLLQDQHYHEVFTEELRMLEKVKDFYKRHPEAVGRIKPHLLRVLESDDPDVIDKRCEGVPFDQIALPPQQSALPHEMTEDDAEAVRYLTQNSFEIGGRLRFVSEQLVALNGSIGRVPCPHCDSGRLSLDPAHWEDPYWIY